MRRLLLPTLAALSAAALAGCGNKGPLVLPARPVAPASATSVPVTPAGASSSSPAPATSAPASTGSR
ncbi:LPS translocon maturation chaperone LptM [Dyella lutea]|uniref:Lipoprotein n=1 Tax=Dyella lutea TaxID=2950441 RepID=A0ABT1F9U8_9GAMM|nr:lipoprotein [Dyella lutea]MCP1372783.1 lipoprotein [Dyella lutea]